MSEKPETVAEKYEREKRELASRIKRGKRKVRSRRSGKPDKSFNKYKVETIDRTNEPPGGP